MNRSLRKILPIISIALSNVLVVNGAFAEEDAVYLEKDKKAPYAGILLPVEKANELRKSLIELDTLKTINESYAKSIQLYKQSEQLTETKYNTLSAQNDKLALALVESRQSSDLQKIVWFGLGVIATGFALYGAKKVTQ